MSARVGDSHGTEGSVAGATPPGTLGRGEKGAVSIRQVTDISDGRG